MKVTGNARPERIWVRYIEKGNAVVRLRDNISEVADDVVDGEMVNRRYEYDEVEVVLAERENLAEYISKNFKALFERGIDAEKEPKPRTKKEIIDDQNDYFIDLDFRLMQVELGF